MYGKGDLLFTTALAVTAFGIVAVVASVIIASHQRD